jgi:hypothetical protein
MGQTRLPMAKVQDLADIRYVWMSLAATPAGHPFILSITFEGNATSDMDPVIVQLS